MSLGRAVTVAACAAVLSIAAPSAASAVVPSGSPPGSNVACTPSAAHPEPVVLVHGTFENQFDNWQFMSPALKKAGYCVYSFNYGAYRGSEALGIYGNGPIEESAKQLRTFVDSVKVRTGVKKVKLVGHSQGGMMPRYYLKNLGGTSSVSELVALNPSNHGTSNPLAPPLDVVCPACKQQATGSPFITALNSGDETPGDIDYTNIVTRFDEVVIPYTSGELSGDRTTNITLQDKCINDTTEHLRTPYDPPAIAITLNALKRNGPADPAYQPPCLTL